jgi:MFS family permease
MPLVASTRLILRLPSMREAMLSSITILASIDILAAYLPLLGEATGLSVQTVGALLAVRAGGSVVSRLFMATVLVRFGRRLVLSTGLGAAGFGMLLLPLADGNVVTLFIGMALVGLGLGLGQPITISWVSTIAPESLRGTALGVRISGNRVTQLVAPALAGGFVATAGVTAIYPLLAVLLFASAGSVLRDRNHADEADAFGAGS